MLDFSFDLCLINFHHGATPNFLYHYIFPSSSIFICQSINQPLPFPKYQDIIAADPGTGIGLVLSVSKKCKGNGGRIFR